jgi:hypothetical protein
MLADKCPVKYDAGVLSESFSLFRVTHRKQRSFAPPGAVLSEDGGSTWLALQPAS